MKKEVIKAIITNAVRKKLSHSNKEPSYMPFHTRLLGKDRLALFSFIQSLNTNFGISLFEPIAIEIVKSNFSQCIRQYTPYNQITTEAQNVIQNIIDNLNIAATSPNKITEINRIRKASLQGKIHTIKPTKVDLMLEKNTGEIYLFDIKSAKPNSNEFKQYKRTLLEWVAVTLLHKNDTIIHTGIAIPYNPYYPAPYARWTMKGMLDLNEELLVAQDFWNFIGGANTYEDLLSCFQEARAELRGELDAYFSRFYIKDKLD